jgi:hypothetical protein
MDDRIFYYEGSDGGFERCLEANDDGSLLYWESPNRFAHMGGAKFRSETLSPAEAKKRWPAYSAEIDRAATSRRSN